MDDSAPSISEITDLNQILCEKITLRQWSETIYRASPKVLFAYKQICEHLESLPPCKLAASKTGLVAIMSYDRELEIAEIDGESLITTSVVKVLPERYPEWCLLEWSESGSLLISTRSSAVIDIFDVSGGYCYSIPMANSSEKFNAHAVISHISTVEVTNDDSKWLDILYVLQYGGVFSCYKIGRLSGYFPLFKVDIKQNITTLFCIVPSANMLVVANQCTLNTPSDEQLSCNSVGLSVYRITTEDPFIVDFKVIRSQISLFDLFFNWLPFSTPKTAVILSMCLNHGCSHMSCVSSSGDIYIFNIPSLTLYVHIPYIPSKNSKKPTQILWRNQKEISVFTAEGLLWSGNFNLLEVSSFSTDTLECFSPHTKLLSLQTGEIFILEAQDLTSSISHSLIVSGNKHAWLAAKLGLTTLFDYFKAYLGVAVGQPLEDVQSSTECRNINFVLHHLRTVTLRQMLDKMLKRGDFDAALELVHRCGIDDVDFVHKRHWKYIGQNACIADVDNILFKISDISWVIDECISYVGGNIALHEALIELAERLSEKLSGLESLFVLHRRRILAILDHRNGSDSSELYCYLRSHSLLDIAVNFAQTSKFVYLKKLICLAYDILSPHLFALLWMIPESVNPERYKEFMPHKDSKWFDFKQDTGVTNFTTRSEFSKSDCRDVHEKLNTATKIYEKLPFLKCYICANVMEYSDVVQYLQLRCYAIDEACGLVGTIISFLELSIAHGFSDLQPLLYKVKFYRDYIFFCGSVKMSLQQFGTSSCEFILKMLSKHMSEDEVCANMERLLEMIDCIYQSGRHESIKGELITFFGSYSRKTVRVLLNAHKTHHRMIDKEVINACLRTFEGVGRPLIIAAVQLDVSEDLIEALEMFSVHGFHLTFDLLLSSISDPVIANHVIHRLLSSSEASTRSQWIELKGDLLKIYAKLYSSLFDVNVIIRSIALQMLEIGRIPFTSAFLDLAFTFSQDQFASDCLSKDESISLVIEKSNYYLNNAEPIKHDENVKLARHILSVAPKGSSASLNSQLRMLDAIDLAIELDCDVMPVKFRFLGADELLQQIVKIHSNYKKVKECATFAKLLHIHTPVARTMELCARQALLVGDKRILRRYCEQLLKNAKGLAGIHTLCISIVRSQLLVDMEEDLIGCSLLNCDEDSLLETLSLLDEVKSRRLLRESNQEKQVVDLYGEIVLDPMYTFIDDYYPPNSIDFDHSNVAEQAIRSLSSGCRFDSDSLLILTRLYSKISSSVALYLSMCLPNDMEWTSNPFLKKYSSVLRFAAGEFPMPILEIIPPHYLMAGNSSETVEGETPLDRILNCGCDRERFFEDAKYREDTLVGLAMTADEVVLSDCLEVAKKFSVNLYLICLSALEYILTEPDLSKAELEKFLSNTTVCECLRSNQELLRSQLHSDMLKRIPAMCPNVLERVKIYLLFFDGSGKNVDYLEALRRIHVLSKGCELPRLISGDVDLVLSVITPLFKEHHQRKSLSQILLDLPNGNTICERLAYELLKRHSLNTETLEMYWHLLNQDVEQVIELIGTLDLPNEEDCIANLLKSWSTDHTMDALKEMLINRLNNIKSAAYCSFVVEDGTSSPILSRRRRGGS